MITLGNRLDDLRENQSLIQFYVRKNCRTCRGRGTKTIEVPTRNWLTGEKGWDRQTDLCDCVKKAVRKEMKEMESG